MKRKHVTKRLTVNQETFEWAEEIFDDCFEHGLQPTDKISITANRIVELMLAVRERYESTIPTHTITIE